MNHAQDHAERHLPTGNDPINVSGFAGDGLTESGGSLAVNVDTTTIAVVSDQLRRAAISGDVTIGAGSATAAITAASIVSADFNSEAATAFTPAFSGTGWSIGNATKTGWYIKHGRLVFLWGEVTMGSTTTYGTGHLGIGGGFPAPAMNTDILYDMWDSVPGAGTRGIGVLFTGLAIVYGYPWVATTAYVTSGQVVSTAPFTWATGDSIRFSGAYIADS